MAGKYHQWELDFCNLHYLPSALYRLIIILSGDYPVVAKLVQIVHIMLETIESFPLMMKGSGKMNWRSSACMTPVMCNVQSTHVKYS